MAAENKYNQELAAAKIALEDIEETLESEDKEDVDHGYNRINEIIKKLKSSTDHSTEHMLGEERSIEEVREWNQRQRRDIKKFRDLRRKLKQQLDMFVWKKKSRDRW